MQPTLPEFVSFVDSEGREAFAFNPAAISGAEGLRRVTDDNVCTFLGQELLVQRRATGLFSKDLTDVDDLIIAVISILLILAVEAVLTAVLLRTENGAISNASFSVKHFVERARQYSYGLFARKTHAPKASAAAQPQTQPIDPKILVFGFLSFVLSFGLQIAVLVLSSPNFTDVDNTMASFEISNDIIADWNQVYENREAAITLPCATVALNGVQQKRTQLSPCLSVNWPTWGETPVFTPANRAVDLTIVSDVHEFGSEHVVTLDGLSARFSLRGTFALEDGEGRQLRQRRQSLTSERRVEIMHKQYLAFLFNLYNSNLTDPSMNLERLNRISKEKLDFTVEKGEDIPITQVYGRNLFRRVTSMRHTTRVSDVIPSGRAAIRFSAALLKGSHSVSVGDGDPYDLMTATGNVAGRRSVMWRESYRTLNWLSLLIMLAGFMVLLVVLRVLLQPTTTTEIAGAFVTRAVEAEWLRAPAYTQRTELKSFRLSPAHDLSGEGDSLTETFSGSTEGRS